MQTLRRFWRDEHGTETVEWAIMIGILAIGAIVAILVINGAVVDRFLYLCNLLKLTVILT